MRPINEIVLKKIPLLPFINSLMEIYNDGANFIDIVGEHSFFQDSIGIVVKEGYFDRGTPHALTESDINELI
jgi:hypothetical protein